MQATDLIRELEKAIDALVWADRHLAAGDAASGALHCAVPVFGSPLADRVHRAHESLRRLLADISPGAPLSPDLDREHQELGGVLLDLDRCDHGRHYGDVCVDCPSNRSVGNVLLPPGTRIGTDIHGRAITVPQPFCRTETAAWRALREADHG